MKVGILALQGDFLEHAQILRQIDLEPVEIRLPDQLAQIDGLIIPGGESTTFGKLATEFKLIEPLREFCNSGKPVLGTCAGMIFLAQDVGRDQPVLGLLDVQVKRNAFGRQVDSFEVVLDIPALEPRAPFHAIFIRAPLVAGVGKNVEVLAKLDDGTIVAVRQGNLIATSFHPELTNDARLHRFALTGGK